MMLFDSQRSIITYVNEFCDGHFDESTIKQWVASRGVSKSVYDDFYASELGKYCLPENLGGARCSFIDRVAMIAQLMRRAGATLPFISDMLTYALLSTMQSSSQREIVEELAQRSGRVFLSQAFTESSAGTDANAVSTTVFLEDGRPVLNGKKSFVCNGQFASDTLVLARDPIFGREDGGLSLWLVPITSDGVFSYPLDSVGQKMLAPAVLEFENVEMDLEWRIQTEGNLSSMLRRQYELGRILVSASSLGLARAAMDDAVAYASEHIVKGRCLGDIPQIQEKLTDMEIKLRSMEMFVYDAASKVNEPQSGAMHLNCALMKYYVPNAATEVASDAMQIFGGRGYTTETRVGRIWRDCRGNQIAQGSDEIMTRTAAKFLFQNRK